MTETMTPSVSDAPKGFDQPEAVNWMGYAIQACSVLLIVVIALVTYHFAFVLPARQKFAVVDIAEVLAIKELQVTLAALSADSTEKGGGAAFDEISRFAKQIEGALGELQKDCACTLMVRAAVIRPSPDHDLTRALKQKLGIDGVDQAQLAKQLQALGGRGVPPNNEGGR